MSNKCKEKEVVRICSKYGKNSEICKKKVQKCKFK